MSTKITQGYKLRDGVSPFDVQREVREVLRPWLLRRNLQRLLDEAVVELDAVRELGRPQDLRCALLKVMSDDVKDKTCSVNATVVLLSRPGTSEVYAMFFGLEGEDVFAGLGCVEQEFGFWDNTDFRPDGVTEADWGLRKQVWSEVLDFRESVGVQGVTVTVLSDYDVRGVRIQRFLDEQEFLSLPSVDERVEYVGKSLYMQARMEDLLGAQSGEGSLDLGAFFDLMHLWQGLEAEARAPWLVEALGLVQARKVSFEELQPVL